MSKHVRWSHTCMVERMGERCVVKRLLHRLWVCSVWVPQPSIDTDVLGWVQGGPPSWLGAGARDARGDAERVGSCSQGQGWILWLPAESSWAVWANQTCLGQEVGQETSRGPFQPRLFGDLCLALMWTLTVRFQPQYSLSLFTGVQEN